MPRCNECSMKKPPLTFEQDLASWIISQMGSALLDAQGNPNVSVIEATFRLNEIPPDIQPILFKDIVTICDELRKQTKDGKQDTTYH